MDNKYFLHQIKVGKTNTTKGIVIHDDIEASKQGYHAFLGAYAYGHDPDATFVQAMVTDMNGIVILPETWTASEEPELEEPEDPELIA